MTQHAYDLVVVGAGHVGSACTLAAAHRGLRVALISPDSAVTQALSSTDEVWDRRVYALSPSSRRFLEGLRVFSKIDVNRTAAVRDMRIFDAVGGGSDLHFSAYQAGSEALAWIVEHRELTRVLDTAIEFQSGIERIKSVASRLEADDDAVRLSAAGREITAALVVGADGAHSPTRLSAGIKASVKPYEQTGVVANFSCSAPHRGCAYQWFTEEGVVALLPLPGDAVSLVWSAPQVLAKALIEEGAAALAARLTSLAQAQLGELAPLGGISGFELSLLVPDHQVAQRVALIGDAAHVVHPLAGQGLNLGFDDARVLVDTLAGRESFRDCGDAVLLRRFERARAEPIWAMKQVTDRLLSLFASEDPVVRGVRKAGMRLVEHSSLLKAALSRYAMG